MIPTTGMAFVNPLGDRISIDLLGNGMGAVLFGWFLTWTSTFVENAQTHTNTAYVTS